MKKLSKRGFTLVEMVLVLAIIVILSAVLFLGLSDYISRAKTATACMAAYNAEVDKCAAECNEA